MIPPSGFKAELYPLRHRLEFAFGLNAKTIAQSATITSFVRGSADTAMNNPNTIEVNPHNTNFSQETGGMCHQMSIIDKINIRMQFTLTEQATDEGVKALNIRYMPIFTSFPEKLASTDTDTGFTAASVLELLSDATNDDVTPLFNNSKCPVGDGTSALNHPVSTVNDTEVFGDLNMDTNLIQEGITWDNDLFNNSLKFFTNKGAIRSMVGRQRTVHLTTNRPSQTIFINKFVPSAVRRIVSMSFFGMLFYCPVTIEIDQSFLSGVLLTSKAHVGVKVLASYHEWNVDHIQDVET